METCPAQCPVSCWLDADKGNDSGCMLRRWWRPRQTLKLPLGELPKIMSIRFWLQVSEKHFCVKTVGVFDAPVTAANIIVQRSVLCYVKRYRIHERYARECETLPPPQYLFFPFFEENLCTVKCKDLRHTTQKVWMNFYSYITNTLIKM